VLFSALRKGKNIDVLSSAFSKWKEKTSMFFFRLKKMSKYIHVLSSNISKWNKNIDVLSSGLSKWENIDVLSSDLSKWKEKTSLCCIRA
jgi:hypothetical protein